MEVTRDVVREAVAAFVPVLLMLAILVGIGVNFAESKAGLTPTGGQAMVGAIVLFVFLMTGVGVWLARSDDE